MTPASAVPEEVRTACLFEAYEVRPRLSPQIEAYVANGIADFPATYAAGASASPGALSSPGGSHVPCYATVQFPVQSSKFPASILREFGGNTLNLFANARAGSPSPASSGKFPCIFPRNREFRDGDGFADDCLHRQFTWLFKTLPERRLKFAHHRMFVATAQGGAESAHSVLQAEETDNGGRDRCQ